MLGGSRIESRGFSGWVRVISDRIREITRKEIPKLHIQPFFQSLFLFLGQIGNGEYRVGSVIQPLIMDQRFIPDEPSQSRVNVFYADAVRIDARALVGQDPSVMPVPAAGIPDPVPVVRPVLEKGVIGTLSEGPIAEVGQTESAVTERVQLDG